MQNINIVEDIEWNIELEVYLVDEKKYKRDAEAWTKKSVLALLPGTGGGAAEPFKLGRQAELARFDRPPPHDP